MPRALVCDSVLFAVESDTDASVGVMGKASDPKAVVDTEGRVIGAKNLRVVDASVFPLLPPGHLLSTVCKLNRPASLL